MFRFHIVLQRGNAAWDPAKRESTGVNLSHVHFCICTRYVVDFFPISSPLLDMSLNTNHWTIHEYTKLRIPEAHTFQFGTRPNLPSRVALCPTVRPHFEQLHSSFSNSPLDHSTSTWTSPCDHSLFPLDIITRVQLSIEAPSPLFLLPNYTSYIICPELATVSAISIYPYPYYYRLDLRSSHSLSAILG